ncbi:hypothetical protein, partial [Leptotrichia sp. OH3620_COT-345]|uniref:hypothetical protein n=1 Tax=Leptotrichia sp. OH3620_COT-345 TaxID=2491048 RepID=UPI0013157158
DSEDYASFYGRQFERYYNRQFGENDVKFITERLKYTKEQLGSDWEDDALKFKINGNITVGGFTPDISGSISFIRNPYNSKIYIVVDIKGDVKFETKLAGTSLNVTGEYYPGVVVPKELREKRDSLSLPYLNKALTIALQTGLNNPYAKASTSILIGKGGAKTAGVEIKGGLGIYVGNENPEFMKKIGFDLNKELKKIVLDNIKTKIKKETQLSNIVKTYKKDVEFSKSYVIEINNKTAAELFNPSKGWRWMF